MKVVMFCGGFGTRLREYSDTIPKPLVPVGSRPIMWHLMKYYAHFGHKEFVLCLGYRGELIREYFLHYDEATSTDFVLQGGDVTLLGPDISDWTISFIDTGLQSNIGMRLKAVQPLLGDDEYFLANYSDGLCDVDVNAMIDLLQARNAVGVFVSVRPPNSLSMVEADDDGVVQRIAYLQNTLRINGGFFVFHRSLFDWMQPGEELVEEPFGRLIEAGKLIACRHDGFWRAMDTFKDKKTLDGLYESGERPWEVWK